MAVLLNDDSHGWTGGSTAMTAPLGGEWLEGEVSIVLLDEKNVKEIEVTGNKISTVNI